MYVAETQKRHLIWFMFFYREWIAEKKHHVNLIAGNTRSNLLIAALLSA